MIQTSPTAGGTATVSPNSPANQRAVRTSTRIINVEAAAASPADKGDDQSPHAPAFVLQDFTAAFGANTSRDTPELSPH
jgi:hypothetical protein